MGQLIPRRSDPTDPTDAEGERIAPDLLPRRSPRGRRWVHDDREILREPSELKGPQGRAMLRNRLQI